MNLAGETRDTAAHDGRKAVPRVAEAEIGEDRPA